MNISSPAISPGLQIPQQFTCDGENVSPPLQWTNVPGNARSLALILDDPDAPNGTFTHWIVYNIPAGESNLPENFSKIDSDNKTIVQGKNSRGNIGYSAPCPPAGKTHNYHFQLFALDQKVNLGPGATKNEVMNQAQNHILDQADLIVPFARAQ